MATRPPRKPNARRQQAAVDLKLAAASKAPEAAEARVEEQDPVQAALQEGVEQLLQQFESILEKDLGVDAELREAMQQQFGHALSEAAASPAATEPPDRAAWMEAVQALHKSGSMDEDSANALVRQLDGLLQPLERRESRLAIEFGRRMQSDGADEALAWFREQRAAAQDSDEAGDSGSPSSVDDSFPFRNETVNSRSRKSRGPPRRR